MPVEASPTSTIFSLGMVEMSYSHVKGRTVAGILIMSLTIGAGMS